jgi:hypothetical protein
MLWILGGLILLAVGVLMRRVLRLGGERSGNGRGLAPLSPERQPIYDSLALELETQAAILGISLNDAFEERDSGNQEIALRLVQLALGEWNRLAELVAALLKTLAKHMSSAQVVVPLRGIVAHRFKSATMINYVRMHELLDQLVFGFTLRFQLHLRVLRRAVETLTAELRQRYRYAERIESQSAELWKQLDLYFHDFDLVAKESLLALRALLHCLPDSALPGIETDLKAAIARGVRSTSAAVDRWD